MVAMAPGTNCAHRSGSARGPQVRLSAAPRASHVAGTPLLDSRSVAAHPQTPNVATGANVAAGAISGGAFLAALLVTLAMAVDVRMGLALLGAVGFATAALVSLPWGIALWLMLSFVAGAFPKLYPALTAGAILLMVAWLGEMIRSGRGWTLLRGPLWVYVLVPLLAAWLLLGITWAPAPGNVRHEWVSWVRSLAIFFIIATTVWQPRHLRLIAGAFVVGAVVSVVLGLLGIEGSGSQQALAEGRLTGGAGDPNLLAAGLVPAIVLAGMFAATARGPERRALALLAIPLLMVGVVLTQSRGAFIGLLAMIIAGLVFARRWRLQIALATLGVIVVAAAAFAAYPGALARLTDSEASGSSGRADLWTVAWRVSEDHPVVGVGLANYPVVAADYVRRPGTLTSVKLIADEPHVVHNTYLSMLAESGVVGAAIFLGIVLAALDALRRAARRLEAREHTAQRAFAVSVLIAAIGTLTTAFFLSSGPDPRMWLLLALAPAALSASERLRGTIGTGAVFGHAGR
jgi:O-antigen ligase